MSDMATHIGDDYTPLATTPIPDSRFGVRLALARECLDGRCFEYIGQRKITAGGWGAPSGSRAGPAPSLRRFLRLFRYPIDTCCCC